MGRFGRRINFSVMRQRTLQEMIIPSEFDYDEEKKSFQEALENFSFKVTSKLCVPGQNLIYSPASLSFTLGMLLEGTAGKSRKEIVEQLFDLKDLDDEESAEKASNFLVYLLDGHPDGIQKLLSVANLFYSHRGFELSEMFVKSIEKKYRAVGQELDFQNQNGQALEVINGDVRDATKGLIPKLFDSIGRDTKAILVNAIHFKGIWSTRFNEEETNMDHEFYLSKGETIKVQMMKVIDEYEIGHYKDSWILRLPYSSEATGEQIYMLVILPDEGQEIKQYLDNFNAEDFNRAIDGAERRTVDVWLPRFKMESTHPLIPTLQAIGIKDVFGSKSDLSKMVANPMEKLKVSDIIQKAVIEVNEEGTEAAAATAISCALTSLSLRPDPRPTFHADRPFIYELLTESKDNVKHILFVGVVENPVA